MQNFAESHQLSVMCSSYSSNVDVFDTGKYTAKLLRVESESESYTHNNNCILLVPSNLIFFTVKILHFLVTQIKLSSLCNFCSV